jgi:hypothetical protein
MPQIFFHDPDGAMIECCNCDILPIEFLGEDAVAQLARGCAACHQQQQHEVQGGGIGIGVDLGRRQL